MAKVNKIRPRPVLSDFMQPVEPGQGMAQIAEGLREVNETFLKPMAFEAIRRDAPNAVTVDKDGNLKAEFMPITAGEFGNYYNRIASATYLDRAATESERTIGQLAMEHATDPKGFEAASRAYTRRLVQNAPSHLRAAIETGADQEASRVYLGILSSATKNARDQFAASSEARIGRLWDRHAQATQQFLDDEVVALEEQLAAQYDARVGAGLMTEEEKLLSIERGQAAAAAKRDEQVVADMDAAVETLRDGYEAENFDLLMERSAGAMPGSPMAQRRDALATARVAQQVAPGFEKLSPAAQAAELEKLSQGPKTPEEVKAIARLTKIAETTEAEVIARIDAAIPILEKQGVPQGIGELIAMSASDDPESELAGRRQALMTAIAEFEIADPDMDLATLDAILGGLSTGTQTPQSMAFIGRLKEQRAERVTELQAALTEATATATAGSVPEGVDALLSADVPELARQQRDLMDALGGQQIMGSFHLMDPDQQRQVTDAIQSGPVTPTKLKVLDDLRQRRQAAMTAIDKDAIGHWQEQRVVADDPVSLGDPSSIRRRIVSLQGLDDSANPRGRVFSDAEKANLRQQVEQSSPSDRVEFARALVEGAGDRVFDVADELEIEGNFGFVAKQLAAGLPEATAASILAGEDPNVPKLNFSDSAKTRSEVEQAFFSRFDEAVPQSADYKGAVVQAAESYARTLALRMPADEAYAEAFGAVIGQNGDRGGIQEVNGRLTLLPPSVTAKQAQDAIEVTVGILGGGGALRPQRQPGMRAPQPSNPPSGAERARLQERAARVRMGERQAFNEVMRQASEGSYPLDGTAAVTADTMRTVTLSPVGNDRYEMHVNRDGVSFALTDAVTGGNFVVSLSRLIAATR